MEATQVLLTSLLCMELTTIIFKISSDRVAPNLKSTVSITVPIQGQFSNQLKLKTQSTQHLRKTRDTDTC